MQSISDHAARAALSLLAVVALLATAQTSAGQAVTDRGVTDYGVPPTYAQTAWPTDHHDPRNSDFSQFVAPTKHRVAWEAITRQGLLPGAATVFAATQGVNDTLYITTSRGRGFRHLDGFNPIDGSADFTVPRWWGGDDTPDPQSIAGTPTHDADGNFYMIDKDQFWSWDKDGNLRWVVPISEYGLEDEDIFLNPIITKEGFVGGITLDGNVVFVKPEDGALAVPVINLPGGAGPPCPPGVGNLFWIGGEVSIETRQIVFCVFVGLDVEIANTAALHPETNRLFIGGAGRTPDVGAMYGIDLVHDGGDSYHWEIAWESPMGSATGASPTISPDGSQVYVTDGSNVLFAFDTETGAEVWRTAEGGESAASPSVAADGTLYASGGGVLLSIDPADGSQLFAESYDHVADMFLDPQPPIPFVIPNGNPVARIASIIAPSPGKVHVPLSLGYLVTATEAFFRPIPNPHADAIIAVDPRTGLLIPDSVTLVPDGVEGALTPLADGRMGVDQAAIFSSVSAYLLNWIFLVLGPQYLIPPPSAGYIGLEPESFREFALEQIDAVLGYIGTAESELPGGDLQETFDELRRGRLQLLATDGTIEEARQKREIRRRAERRARAEVADAQAALDQAADLLLGDPSVADQNAALTLGLEAREQLNRARNRLD